MLLATTRNDYGDVDTCLLVEEVVKNKDEAVCSFLGWSVDIMTC